MFSHPQCCSGPKKTEIKYHPKYDHLNVVNSPECMLIVSSPGTRSCMPLLAQTTLSRPSSKQLITTLLLDMFETQRRTFHSYGWV